MTEEIVPGPEKSVGQRINWPAVVLFIFVTLSAIGCVFGFLLYVPQHTQDKLFNMPWESILPMLIPALSAAFGTVWAFFMGPLLHPKETK